MLQLRGKTGSPHKGDGTLSQSSKETFEAVLARLKTNRCVQVCVCLCDKPGRRMPHGRSLASFAQYRLCFSMFRGRPLLQEESGGLDRALQAMACSRAPAASRPAGQESTEGRGCPLQPCMIFSLPFRLQRF